MPQVFNQSDHEDKLRVVAIPPRRKKKLRGKIKTLATIDEGMIKVWFDKKSKSILFRRKRNRVIDSISLQKIYDLAAGQLTMKL